MPQSNANSDKPDSHATHAENVQSEMGKASVHDTAVKEKTTQQQPQPVSVLGGLIDTSA